MTKTEIRAWRARWKLVNELEIEDLRQTPMDVKFRQLAALMGSVDAFQAREALEQDDEVSYDRWQRFRAAYARRQPVRS